ncbi:MAG: SUMF1/EgtB/PvdO family nonheme iron enzyme [Oscillibacter sp.]|nr:SUMF1/EgtB/PvdO family nonheme iron enzyme [Oscillibacter sp.]
MMKRLFYVWGCVCIAFLLASCSDGDEGIDNEVVARFVNSEDRLNPENVGEDFTETAFGVNMQMVYVKGDTFMMGANPEQELGVKKDELPAHQVVLSSFYIAQYEVTQEQWEAVMGTTIEEQCKKAGYPEFSKFSGEGYPMFCVSWEDAQRFCNKLSEKTGLTYVLPSEAQWEYAARGGEDYVYSGSNVLDDVAWYSGNSEACVHRVGLKGEGNALGLYDMSGNVWEWCSDWYGSYSDSLDTDPMGPEEGSSRVYRGGSWHCTATNCRVANRHSVRPKQRNPYLGFRVALLIKEVTPEEPGEEDFTETVGDFSFDMIYVKGGTFMMGATEEQGNDARDNEIPVHEVTLSDYYIGKFEMTQGLWKAVMGEDFVHFEEEGDDYPVMNISWHEVDEFLSVLNRLTGRKYALPTEAQWEYAARGGVKSEGYKYSGSDEINEVAWYLWNSEEIYPVGRKKPNELGIYDMSGNVLEWCSDWYGSYSRASQSDPTGPATGSDRVLRGGAWHADPVYCRVSSRNSDHPDSSRGGYGFRVVLVP